jgi:hypothetical protein
MLFMKVGELEISATVNISLIPDRLLQYSDILSNIHPNLQHLEFDNGSAADLMSIDVLDT